VCKVLKLYSDLAILGD